MRGSGQSRAAGWWPALDALRGLAVLAVLAYHHDPTRVPGGFLGVSLFFTLSGFLITTIVLREHDETGGLSARRFWGRRFRRLAPVAFVGLLLALAVSPLVVEPARMRDVAGDATAAALDVANWRFAGQAVGYGDAGAAPSPVLHYWSLAVEEQFYVVLPIVALLALRRSRRAFAGALALLAAASLAAQLLQDDPNRAYLGTDTRAFELLVGALAACAWSARHRLGARARARVRTAVDVAGAVALAGFVLAWATVDLHDPRLWQGGMALHAGAAAALTVAAVGGRVVPRLGRVRPLTALGAISYGAYVVHFPLFLVLSPDRVHVDGLPLLVLRVAATVAAATLLRVLLEEPVRHGGALPAWQGPVALVTAMAMVVVVAAGLPRLDPPAPTTAIEVAGQTVLLMPTTSVPAITSLPPSTEAAPPAPTEAAPASSPPPTAVVTTVPPPGPATPTTPAPAATRRPPHLLVVGDSTAFATGTGMQQWATQTGRAVVDVTGVLTCSFQTMGTMRFRPGWEEDTRPDCADLLLHVGDVARDTGADAVVLFLNTMMLADWRLPGDATFRSMGDPLLDAAFLQAGTTALASLSTAGVPILWTDVPVPAWTPQPGVPGSGPVVINDAGRTARLNQLERQLAALQPLVRVVPYAACLAGPDGSIPPGTRSDGLHAAPAAIPSIMDACLAGALHEAYDAVATTSPLPGGVTLAWG